MGTSQTKMNGPVVSTLFSQSQNNLNSDMILGFALNSMCYTDRCAGMGHLTPG